MKQKLSFIAILAIASSGASAFDFSVYQDWFGFSTASYASGETLSDKGATGGTWGTLPAGAMAEVSISKSTTNLVVDTLNSESALIFTSNDRRWSSGTFYCRFVARFPECESVPLLADDAKAAFTVANNEAGEAAFWGYGAEGWTELRMPSSAVQPAYDTGFDYLIAFSGNRVSYYMRKGDGDYEEMSSKDGSAFDFPIGGRGDTRVDRVELDGKGAISGFSGGYRNSGATIRIRQ